MKLINRIWFFINLRQNNNIALGSVSYRLSVFFVFFFFDLGFLAQTFANHRTTGEWGGHFFNSSLPLPLAPQILRHQPSGYCRDITSAYSLQPEAGLEPETLVSERKPLTIKLRAQSIVGLFPQVSHQENFTKTLWCK